MNGKEFHFGTLETIVDGEVVDIARVVVNGNKKIKVSKSKEIANGEYRGSGDFNEDLEGLKKLVREVASIRYSPGIFGRLIGKRNPHIEVNYIDEIVGKIAKNGYDSGALVA